jgi:hypothetical protein
MEMSQNQGLPAPSSEAEMVQERRRFLASCGTFAVVTPPAITLLLSTSLNSPAIASSSGGKGKDKDKGNNGFGNGGDDGSHNGKEDDDR